MSQRTKIQYQGREVEAERINIENSNERPNVYNLSDGSTINLRTVALAVVRLVGEWTEDGDPVYVISSTNMVSADVPPDVKRRKG